jgi:lysophospholipase L1-like esterase
MQMKKLLVISVVILFIFLTYIFLQTRVDGSVQQPTAGTTIVAFGDSLVAGVGSTEGNDFVSVLEEKIGEDIVNAGVSGDTTAAGLKRIDEVLAQNPRVVMVLLGGNDFLRRLSKEETFAHLEQIIQSIQNTGAAVVLLGVRGGVVRDEYKDEFEYLAKEYNTAYVENVLDGLIGKTELMSDPIHPNDAGYRIIAERVYPALQQVAGE